MRVACMWLPLATLFVINSNWAAAKNLREPVAPLERELQLDPILTVIVGSNGLLGECQGNCDSDADCDAGLECFSSFSFTIPGCTGARIFGSNFCYVNESAPPPAPGSSGACEPCSSDNECEDGLFCFQEFGASAPGCSSTPTDFGGFGGFGGFGSFGDINTPLSNVCVVESTPRPSRAPTTATPTGTQPTEEQTDVDVSLFIGSAPFGLCEGPCFANTDCDLFGLSCVDGSSGSVPGCSGNTFQSNLCAIPPAGTLVLKGDEDEPSTAFPLGECEGDCDVDGDCAPGLLCFQRDGLTLGPVPGCNGIGLPGYDYCFKDPEGTPLPSVSPVTAAPTEPTTSAPSTRMPTSEPTFERTASPTAEATVVPLLSRDQNCGDNNKCGRCEGQCVEDSQCEFGLNCFSGFATRVPGCSGTKGFIENFCFSPPEGTLVLKGDETGAAFPLGECEGDCDSDADCQEGLLCFERANFGVQPVPGCAGFGDPGSDYCYRAVSPRPTTAPTGPTTSRPTRSPSTSSPSTARPTNPPEPTSSPSSSGPTFQPTTGEPTFNPSNRPTRSPNTQSPTNRPTEPTTRRPTAAPTFVLNLKVDGTTIPYGLCEGDCQSDSECDFGLLCSNTIISGTQSFFIPGCNGFNFAAARYCVSPPPGVLVIAGLDDEPSSLSNFPLKECQGDCDFDSDCEGSLKCFFRDSNEIPRGCVGTAENGVDYCFDPLRLSESGDNNTPPENFPLGICEGDCDNNLDCEGGLFCFERSGFEPVPGCNGPGVFGKDYCILPNNNPIF